MSERRAMLEMSELSLQAVEDEVETSKRRGTLYYYFFGTCRKRTRSGWSPPSTTWTPLHAACYDRDGQRGEAKIALLLDAAREDGIAVDQLVKERRTDTPICYDLFSDTPLDILAKNPAATDRALELVFSAWPGVLVEPPADGHATPLELAIRMGASHQRLPSKVATLLRLTESTTIGVSPLVMHRSPREGDTALGHALTRLQLHSVDNVLNVVERLLQACPASGVVTDFVGNNIVHVATSISADDAIAHSLVQRVVENTTKTYLAAMLSTENECILDCEIHMYGNLDYYVITRGGGSTYEATPVCHIERNGLVQTRELLVNLAKETDADGWTLLHYAAANILCDGDPQEKQKREMERETRAAVSRIRYYDSWIPPPPPNGPRQGTKKLVDWLLQVHPGACSQRDSSRRFPLHLAVNTGKVWSNGIESLTQGYPEAVAVQDPMSGLFPFMTAASQPDADLDTIYSLLRFNPSVVHTVSLAN